MRLLLALFIFAGSAACAPVRPWERGALAHASMDPAAADRTTAEDFVGHCFDVREGATGGLGRAGGGCGCN